MVTDSIAPIDDFINRFTHYKIDICQGREFISTGFLQSCRLIDLLLDDSGFRKSFYMNGIVYNVKKLSINSMHQLINILVVKESSSSFINASAYDTNDRFYNDFSKSHHPTNEELEYLTLFSNQGECHINVKFVDSSASIRYQALSPHEISLLFDESGNIHTALKFDDRLFQCSMLEIFPKTNKVKLSVKKC
ncbi:hypothetical protein J9B83_13390 [Marinomonas sp. A79]|uniref:Uncharacterized protein n=1 Tax=Marinomonas vulgaris TaxID=2823372 RepID=A0ABS5HE37_9GAMM|nr:hypothetical protein [Marinomonas vulgaris]MBR7889915.1 hypothetical protein [Marinomonas vulgaris]